MNTLDQLEKKAKETIQKQYPAFRVIESGVVVLALTRLIRKFCEDEKTLKEANIYLTKAFNEQYRELE